MSDAVIQRLVHYLSANETRSGEAIGAKLGCSRSAVWKHVVSLRELGVEVDAIAGQGYVLREPLELLESQPILAVLEPGLRQQISSLDIRFSVDSTNSELQRLPPDKQHAAVLLAEHQSHGRGRRGRQWISPFGRNLYLSLGWKFEQSLSELGCLPLVVALAAAVALERAGLRKHCVKWPNDLLLDGCKLGGCLVEVQGDAQGPCHAVLGVGINVQMPENGSASGIDQPWTDLQTHKPGVSRNRLAGLMLGALFKHLSLFSEQGFIPFRTSWENLDVLKGKPVSVYGVSGSQRGVAKGIDDRGALLLDTGNGVKALHSGEVSLNGTGI